MGAINGPISGGQQRDAIKLISPPWLSSGVGEKFMYNLGLSSDAVLEKLNQAVRARMPGLGTPTALSYLGLDRVLTQGPSESNDSFALRLKRAFPTWQLAGNRHAVLEQALVYVANYHAVSATQVPRGVIVGNAVIAAANNASWDWYYNTSNIQEPTNHVRKVVNNWNWDNQVLWWRAWLILFFEAGATIGAEATWGNGTWGQTGGSWGLNVEESVFTQLRSLLRLWKSAPTYYPYIIICFNGGSGTTGDELSPNSVSGAGNPDGNWGSHGKNVSGVWVTSRPNTCRFVDGSGIYQNCSIHTGT